MIGDPIANFFITGDNTVNQITVKFAENEAPIGQANFEINNSNKRKIFWCRLRDSNSRPPYYKGVFYKYSDIRCDTLH